MTVLLPTHLETKIAECEGFAAQRRGLARETNPYSPQGIQSAELARCWLRGYEFAEEHPV